MWTLPERLGYCNCSLTHTHSRARWRAGPSPHCRGPPGKGRLVKAWSEWIRESGSQQRRPSSDWEFAAGPHWVNDPQRRARAGIGDTGLEAILSRHSPRLWRGPQFPHHHGVSAQGAALQETKEEICTDSHAHPSSPSRSHKCRHAHPFLLPLLYTEQVKPDLPKLLSLQYTLHVDTQALGQPWHWEVPAKVPGQCFSTLEDNLNTVISWLLPQTFWSMGLKWRPGIKILNVQLVRTTALITSPFTLSCPPPPNSDPWGPGCSLGTTETTSWWSPAPSELRDIWGQGPHHTHQPTVAASPSLCSDSCRPRAGAPLYEIPQVQSWDSTGTTQPHTHKIRDSD